MVLVRKYSVGSHRNHDIRKSQQRHLGGELVRLVEFPDQIARIPPIALLDHSQKLRQASSLSLQEAGEPVS